MESHAIQAGAASPESYRSFAGATRSVLDLLARHLPGATILLAHLDRGQDVHRIIDTRGGAAFGLHSNLGIPLASSFCAPMAEDRAPRLCNDVAANPLYRRADLAGAGGVAAYLGVPIELFDGSRVGSLAAMAAAKDTFNAEHERLFGMLARVLAYELERETSERDLRRLNDALRGHARSMAAMARVARALAGSGDARPVVCQAVCEAAMAPVALLLEPSGRDFVSTAMIGVEMAPVTIHAREGDGPAQRPIMGREGFFIADARSHAAIAAPLVEATGARSALFEPVLRDGNLAAIVIVIWQSAIVRVDESTANVLRVLAAQAAVAVEQAGLRRRVESLSLTDRLTGLGSRRSFDQELPRELARARRGEQPVCVGVLDLDHLSAFNMLRGEREGDLLIKEAAAAWSGGLREVDTVARLDGETFGVLLPGAGLGEAVEVIDRLRALTPRAQTASAGVARWDGTEPAELLLLRANDALAAAKGGGRDMTIPAD